MATNCWPLDRSELAVLMYSTNLGFIRLLHMRNPKLNTVRLVDVTAQHFYEAQPWLREHVEIWESCISDCDARGIRFEFASGELVREASRDG